MKKRTNVKKLTKAVKCYKMFNQSEKQITHELYALLCKDFEEELNRLINEKEF